MKGSARSMDRSLTTIAKSSSSLGGGARDVLIASIVLEAGTRWYCVHMSMMCGCWRTSTISTAMK